MVQFGFGADAALVGAGGLEADGEGVGYIQPDHRQQLAVIHRDVIIDYIPDERAMPFQTAAIREPAEGETGPALAGNPDEQHQHTYYNQQQLAGQQAGQDEDGGGDNPQVACHRGQDNPLPPRCHCSIGGIMRGWVLLSISGASKPTRPCCHITLVQIARARIRQIARYDAAIFA